MLLLVGFAVFGPRRQLDVEYNLVKGALLLVGATLEGRGFAELPFHIAAGVPADFVADMPQVFDDVKRDGLVLKFSISYFSTIS